MKKKYSIQLIKINHQGNYIFYKIILHDREKGKSIIEELGYIKEIQWDRNKNNSKAQKKSYVSLNISRFYYWIIVMHAEISACALKYISLDF